MKKALLFALFFLLLTRYAIASNGNPPTGARAWGLGGATVTVRDTWAVFNNIAGITGAAVPAAGVFYDNRYNVKAFSNIAMGAVMPLKGATSAGLGISKWGDEYYNELKAGLGIAHKINFMSLGAQLTYHQTSIYDLGARRTFVLNMGGIAELIPQLHFGAHVYNVNQAKMAEYGNETLPTIMKAGFSYLPTAQLMLNLETEKELNYNAMLKAGIEYHLAKILRLRTGFSTQTGFSHFGFGVQHKGMMLDYALSTHSRLGWSNHLSLTYTFRSTTRQTATED